MESAVTDLPDPDSPTSATVSPFFHGKGDAIDGERLPLPLPEGNGQIADNQKRPFC
jgi:hypothetical protein